MAERAAREALLQYRQAGWPVAACLGVLAATLWYGPRPAPAALDECTGFLDEADLNVQANVLPFIAGLEAIVGKFDRARERLRQSRSIFEELGQGGAAETNCGAMSGEVEALAGDLAAAEHALRSSYDALERSGNRAYLATRATALADVVYRQERYEEAERYVAVARANTASDDLITQWAWCAVSGKLHARQAEFAEAQRLASEAVLLLSRTDVLNMRAKALLDLAEVLQLAGLATEAGARLEEALDLFRQKGNLIAAEWAQRRFDEVTVPK
jgi:tetratricopeptide (TPR) repeat protein